MDIYTALAADTLRTIIYLKVYNICADFASFQNRFY
jgi:hypothetical protein